jgi:hypothetical protein
MLSFKLLIFRTDILSNQYKAGHTAVGLVEMAEMQSRVSTTAIP